MAVRRSGARGCSVMRVSCLGALSSLATGATIVLFLGVLFALSPAAYRDSVVILVRRSYQPRMRSILDEMGGIFYFGCGLSARSFASC